MKNKKETTNLQVIPICVRDIEKISLFMIEIKFLNFVLLYIVFNIPE